MPLGANADVSRLAVYQTPSFECLSSIFSWHVVVVVVDSHIRCSVSATEETTVTQQVSHRHIR